MVRLQRSSGLLVTSADDLMLRVYDVDMLAGGVGGGGNGTPQLVRQFEGHSNRVTDLAFSADGRWLVSAAMDATVRVWDLPQGRCIDWFAVKKPVTSLSLSPTRDFLATTHVEDVGIYMVRTPAIAAVLSATCCQRCAATCCLLPAVCHVQHLPSP